MSGAVIEAGFDYAAIDPDGRDDVREAAVRIRLRMSRTIEDIIQIGLDLISVKKTLKHGQFEHWIEAEFRMQPRAAQKFMSLASRFGDKSATVAHLPLSVLYALAAPTTDDETVEEIIQRSASGEAIDRDDVATLKAERKALKEEKKALKLDLKDAVATQQNYASQIEDLRHETAVLRDKLDTVVHERDHALKGASPAQAPRLEIVRSDDADMEARIAGILSDFMRLPRDAQAQFLKRASSALLAGAA